MGFTLRSHQSAAIAAVYSAWEAGENNLLVDMATGTGKGPTIAALVKDIATRWPDTRILVVSDTQEIVKQDVEYLFQQWPDAPVGINAEALGRRDYIHKIIVAQVQSIHRTAHKLGTRNIVIVDEAHRIPRIRDAMYQKVFRAVEAQEILGFTATDYRLDSGRLTEGKNALFSKVVYEFGFREALLAGWVVPFSSKNATAQIDTTNVHVRGGEFVTAELEAVANDDALVERSCAEIIRRCVGRRTILVFCCSVNHAFKVAETLRRLGEPAATITGETLPAQRFRLLEEFKAGTIRFMTNVAVLTTGSNVPPIGVVLLRATLSTGLYVQIVGRGSRPSPETGKEQCLLLDFGGNIRRHGPIDAVDVNFEPSSLKDCPQCDEIVRASVETCPSCGYLWEIKRREIERKPRQIKHDAAPEEAPVHVTKYVPEWTPVTETEVRRHVKHGEPDAPPTLRVEYLCGLRSYPEWICFEHHGFSRIKAANWWVAMGGAEPVPETVTDALDRQHELDPVIEILPVPDGKWWRIRERRLADGSIVNSNCQRWKKPEPENVPFNDEVQF